MAIGEGDPLQGKRIVVMGDSVMGSLQAALTAAAPGSVSGETRPGCGWLSALSVHTLSAALNRGCADTRGAYLDRIAAAATAADAVLLLSTWEDNDHLVGGEVLELGTPAWDAWFLSELEALRARLGTKLVLTTIPLGGPAHDAASGQFVYTQGEADQARLDHIALLFRIFAAQHSSDVSVVDLNRIVCPERFPCPGRLDGVVLRPESGGHFDAAGAAWVAPRYLTAVGDTLAAQEWMVRPWPTPATPTPTPTTTTAAPASTTGAHRGGLRSSG